MNIKKVQEKLSVSIWIYCLYVSMGYIVKYNLFNVLFRTM
jgi:hypothetical protein